MISALLFAIAALSALRAAAAEGVSAAEREFFETRIRPVLADRCYHCHNSSELAEGGLALDHRRALLAGGDSGSALKPGEPSASRLLQVIRHEIDGQEMPNDGPQLPDRVIADIAKWIEMGAPDPRDNPPPVQRAGRAASWEATLLERKKWWSFQPIVGRPPPGDTTWSSHPIDRFIHRSMIAKGLQPNGPADDHALLRRACFAITGLPPSGDQIAAFARDTSPDRFERLVDTLLDSPAYGERWARHWMDWIRYAETHGSEGDPEIHNAWHYRDYLIRALNADVPYDQLVREHIAGDLLEEPRINHRLAINESLIGTAHWRMVFHGFAPTDALEERVRFTDDQINAFSKSFLGVTLSCARCHDHKFDPLSQADYYAMYGVLNACRPGRAAIDLPEKLDRRSGDLEQLKQALRGALAGDWLADCDSVASRLAGAEPIWRCAEDPGDFLHPWLNLRRQVESGRGFRDAWNDQQSAWGRSRREAGERQRRAVSRRWDLAGADYAAWFKQGNGLGDEPSRAGEFSIAVDDDEAVVSVLPAGIYSHTLSSKHSARLASPDWKLDGQQVLWARAMGLHSTFRYVIQDFPRGGTVYPVVALTDTWRWHRLDLTYWEGDQIHLEFTAAQDAPLLVKPHDRSWFGVREVMAVPKGQPAPVTTMYEPYAVLIDDRAAAIDSFESLAEWCADQLRLAIEGFAAGDMTDAQALFLDNCLRAGVLMNRLDRLPSARELVQRYRSLEADVVVATRVPGLEQTEVRAQPLFVRGDHRRPGRLIAPRFLEAIDPTPYPAAEAGRPQLAESVLDADNPLTRRVIVNRVWHHLIGRGIVATPDNLGKLGARPTHPGLLDYLARRFSDDGWSLKSLLRLIVTSKTWQLAAGPSRLAGEVDPENRLLSHAGIRRMEAESIRDSLLFVSGRMDRTLYGPPVKEDAPRRSIYLQVRRNHLHPFLRVFDFPEPYTATGRRDTTNVPAQSLTMLNDAWVRSQAEAWAQRILSAAELVTDRDRARAMIRDAFGRPPSDSEIDEMLAFIAQAGDRVSQQEAWSDLARAIVCLKEFIYLR